MIKRKDLTTTIAVQSIGVFATMAFTLAVANRLGSAGQGFWAEYRTLLDFTVIIGLFGLPMAIPYLINARNVSEYKLLKFCFVFSVALLPIIALIFYLLWCFQILQFTYEQPLFEIAIVCGSSFALMLNELLCAISLATTKTIIFNILRVILPTTQLLFFYVWPVENNRTLLIAMISSNWMVLITTVLLWSLNRRKSAGLINAPLQFWDIFRLSRWNFATTALRAATPLIAIQYLAAIGTPTALIGCFSIALFIQGAALAPANMAGPHIYNAWSAKSDEGVRKESYMKLSRTLLFISMTIVAVTLFMLDPIVNYILDPSFKLAILPAKIVVLVIPFCYWAQLLSNLMLSQGGAKYYSYSSGARLVGLCIGVLLIDESKIIDMAIVFVFIEMVNFAVLAISVHCVLRWSLSEIFDLRLVKSRSAG